MAHLRVLALATLLVAHASVALAMNAPFIVGSITNGAMVVEHPKMYTPGTTPLGAGVDVTLSFEGQVPHAKQVTAGTMHYKIYESGVQHFIAEGSIPYFRCNNKGCDRSDGISLHLVDPTASSTWYTADVPITMPKAVKTGDFTLVVWGTDERHYPYDFSMSLEYSYGADAAIADDATRVAVEEGSWKPGSIVYNVTDGDFAISKVVMESATGAWGPGATAKVVFLGESFVKLTAGTLRWKIYEAGMKYFVGQGSTPFFRCTNKGCDTAQGIALKLTQPKANKTSFQLITTFVMPKAQATGQFKVVFWGVDQVHYPYLFDSTIAYNFAPSVNTGAPLIYKPADVTYTAKDGNMSVTFFQVLTENGTFVAGQEAQVQQLGAVFKKLTAGAVQWQVYEQGIRSFVQSGDADYFKCTNKGCDTMDPLALSLSADTLPATYMLSFNFAVPKPMATGEFTLVSWGVDQDHTPYDYTILAHFKVPMQ